jgi:predicted transcriptional regulator
MSENQIEVLSRVVDRYDTENRPVTPAEIATTTGSDVETVRSCFENLEANCLLTAVDGGGYRPTITARELLELDVDDDTFLILDTCSEEQQRPTARSGNAEASEDETDADGG